MKLYCLILVFFTLTGCNRVVKDEINMPLAWSFTYENAPISSYLVKSEPTIVNDNQVIVMTDGSATGLDVQTGNKVWRKSLFGPPESTSRKLLFNSQGLYIKHHQTDLLISIDHSNGEQNWSVNGPGKFFNYNNDAQSEESLFLSGNERVIFQYTKDGEFQRRIDLDQYARSILYHENYLIVAQAWKDVDDEYASGRILSINLSDLRTRWEYITANSGGFVFTPLELKGNVIYGGTTEGPGEFVALDVHTGQVLWKKPNLMTWSYTLSDSAVFVNDGGSILALDIATGNQLWKTQVSTGHGQDNVAYLDGYLYHSHGYGLYVLDASTGRIIHNIPASPDGSPFSNLAAAHGRVFVQSDYHLYCYKAF